MRYHPRALYIDSHHPGALRIAANSVNRSASLSSSGENIEYPNKQNENSKGDWDDAKQIASAESENSVDPICRTNRNCIVVV